MRELRAGRHAGLDGRDVEVWHLDRKTGRLEREKKVKQSFEPFAS